MQLIETGMDEQTKRPTWRHIELLSQLNKNSTQMAHKIGHIMEHHIEHQMEHHSMIYFINNMHEYIFLIARTEQKTKWHTLLRFNLLRTCMTL